MIQQILVNYVDTGTQYVPVYTPMSEERKNEIAWDSEADYQSDLAEEREIAGDEY